MDKYEKVKQWRIDNPEKYKEQKRKERERRKLKKEGKEITYEKRIPWNTGKKCPTCGPPKSSIERKRIRRLISNARDRSNKKEIPFDIGVNDIEVVTHCPYLNVEIDYSGGSHNNMASLDRVTPELGYVKGNVRIISMLANQMKSSATIEQLLIFSEGIKKLHGGVK